MALHPKDYSVQDRLQPGGRGEYFQANIPGYRAQEDRVNRTNMKLNASEHDIPNIKYQFDYRLPALFRYGYGVGFNQIVVPKGRIVAVDPNMDLVDFDTKKHHNTLTLANGGVPVRLRAGGDSYAIGNGQATDLVSTEAQNQAANGIGKEWIPLAGFADTYEDKYMRPFKEATGAAQLDDADLSIDSETGKVVVKAGAAGEGTVVDTARPGNIPIGMMQRNEYTRDDDAYNGMMPGPVMTDKLVELPWFAYKDKAEQNPWGSAYGGLFPGALVRSDENGRITLSALSFMESIDDMTVQEYELERQQVIGQVYSVYNDLLPEGAAKWATWALEDRLNFDEFNPSVWAKTNRKGEDAVSNTPYHSAGEYPGYPYDKAYKNHDLHMLASGGRMDNFDSRMNQQYRYENLGIPGLTDGKNAVVRAFDPERAGYINNAGDRDYVDMFFRTTEVELEPGSLEISVGGEAFVTCTQGALLTVGGEQFLKVKYADEKQGIVVLEVTDKTLADAATENDPLEVKFKFRKRGMAGVPTFLDWDGAVGAVKILLTK